MSDAPESSKRPADPSHTEPSYWDAVIPLVLLMHVRIPAQETWIAFPAYFAFLVGVSWLSYRHVELPYMGGARR